MSETLTTRRMRYRAYLFATDLIYHLANANNVEWKPRGLIRYQRDNLTPMSNIMEEGIKILLAKKRIMYENEYRRLLSRGFGIYGFKDCATSVISNFRWDINDEIVFFETCVRVAQFAILYYLEGVLVAPHYAVEAIAECLFDHTLKFGPGLWAHFNRAAFYMISNEDNHIGN